jgi:hypothetical protein
MLPDAAALVTVVVHVGILSKPNLNGPTRK